MTTPLEVISAMVKMIERVDCLELNVLENAIQSRRYLENKEWQNSSDVRSAVQ